MRKYAFLSFLILVCIVCQLVFFIYVISTYDKRVSRFRVEERLFREAVNFSCTNFLLSYVSDLTNVLQSTSKSPDIVVKLVNLSTWADYSGNFHCLIDDARYSVGDYCPLGLIVLIDDGRVYCKKGDDTLILRSIARDDSPSRPRSGAPATDGAEGGAL